MPPLRALISAPLSFIRARHISGQYLTALRDKREVVTQLRGLTLQAVLVDSQTSDFRFKGLPRNSQFGRCA